jgi:hypothetical protein
MKYVYLALALLLTTPALAQKAPAAPEQCTTFEQVRQQLPQQLTSRDLTPDEMNNFVINIARISRQARVEVDRVAVFAEAAGDVVFVVGFRGGCVVGQGLIPTAVFPSLLVPST